MTPEQLRAGLAEWVRTTFPGATIASIVPLGPDGGAGATGKAAGYGLPLRVTLILAGGDTRDLVFHTAAADEFGHDRRSDRAAEQLLAFDTYPLVPGQVAARDVGAIGPDGKLLSLRTAGEFFLITDWAAGRPYAEDLRRIAKEGLRPIDRERCDALVGKLLELHAQRADGSVQYRRSVRDLVGHGEGIFGIVDGYPEGVPGAPLELLKALERRCLEWRWRLKGRSHRLARIHGDFHPFNVVFGEGVKFALLDASRGCLGDPADDVTAMAINYVFFALEVPGAWTRGLGELWRRFWGRYLEQSGDDGLLAAAPPFLAWRALVVCSPRFYPGLSGQRRAALLGWADQALAGEAFDPASAEALFP